MWRILEPQVVLTPLVQKMSFKAMGIPVSAFISPLRIASSARVASSIADSLIRVI